MSSAKGEFAVWQRLTAGAVFAITLTVYILTLEHGASYWDCPEYIAQAARMQVGHPPGNPTWLLFVRVLAMLAPAPQYVALMVNLSSALFTALAAGVLSLVTGDFTRSLICNDSTPDRKDVWICTGASVVAALSFAWCDTAWFSAVEAEVYAFSIFITVLCLRIAQLWGQCPDTSGRARWMLLLAYVTGLSIGVHQLNLLCLPALALLMCWMRHPGKYPKWFVWGALGASVFMIACILFGLMPGAVETASRVELVCVNGLGLPYNSGLVVYVALDLLLLTAAIWVTRQGANPILTSVLVFAAMWISGVLSFGGNLLIGAVASALVAIAIAWGGRRLHYAAYLGLWSTALLTVGFCIYGVLIIRANASPPMNEGNPSDIFQFASYLGREQYGSRPLLYGRTPNSVPMRDEKMTVSAQGDTVYNYPGVHRTLLHPRYSRFSRGAQPRRRPEFATAADTAFNEAAFAAATAGRDAYVISDYAYKLTYTPETNMWFPRIVSSKPTHIEAYDSWIGMNEGTMVSEHTSYALDSSGQAVARYDNSVRQRVASELKRPTYAQNLEILFSYQIGYMYLRYLMWNFCGRQNDVPSQGQTDAGNFITGFAPLDRLMIGDDSLRPHDAGAGEDSVQRYWMLPLLLGIVGMVWQYSRGRRGRRQFTVVLLLFVMTGVAIVIYLNQTPGEARERDYSFIGSFMAFCIWIGMGAACLARTGARIWKRRPSAGAFCGTMLALGVPLLMFGQNYRSHDRSRRSATADFARNILASVPDNALLIVNGDNYTFPLWYMQDVEGFRTDVRVINLAYLTTPWYARQLATPQYDAAPVPMTADPDQLAYGTFNSVVAGNSGRADAVEALRRLYASGVPRIEVGELTWPTSGTDSIKVKLRAIEGKSYLPLGKLLLIDIIATNANSPSPRPVYWITALPASHMVTLADYNVNEGLVSRLTDRKRKGAQGDLGEIATLMPNGFRYGGFGRGAWPDEPGAQQIRQLRRVLRTAASQAVEKGDTALALQLLQIQRDSLPTRCAPFSVYASEYLVHNEAVETAGILDRCGRKSAAVDTLRSEIIRLARMRQWFDNLPRRLRHVASFEAKGDIASFYYPVDEYLRIGGAREWLDTTHWLKDYDLERSAQIWHRSREQQFMRRKMQGYE